MSPAVLVEHCPKSLGHLRRLPLQRHVAAWARHASAATAASAVPRIIRVTPVAVLSQLPPAAASGGIFCQSSKGKCRSSSGKTANVVQQRCGSQDDQSEAAKNHHMTAN